MKAVFTNNNVCQAIQVGEKSDPHISSHEVLIKVCSVSVNPIDWKFPGLVCWFYPFSMIIGHDCSGEVVAVGGKVKNFKPGDKVYACKSLSFRGSYAEFFPVNENKVAHVPGNMPLDEAGAVPLVSLTALAVLKGANVSEGDRVLINGASGGVGHVAVQIAKSMGLHVTAVCSERNIEFVESFGADKVIDYTKGDPLLSGTEKYDLVFDCIGNLSYSKVKSKLNKNKRYVTTLNTPSSIWHMVKSYVVGRFLKSWNTGGFHVFSPNQRDLSEVTRLIDQGDLSIFIEKKVPFGEVKAAFRESQQGRTRGKVILLLEGE